MRHRFILVVLLFALVAAACGDDAPARDTSGNIVEQGSASVFALQIGDCFDDDPSGAQTVSEVAAVPCSQPHDNEIYYEYEMTDAVFPGNDGVVQAGGQRCLTEFAAFVGMDYADSDLDLFPITPTAESWDNGDRTVYCAVYALDLSKLTGSMRNARR